MFSVHVFGFIQIPVKNLEQSYRNLQKTEVACIVMQIDYPQWNSASNFTGTFSTGSLQKIFFQILRI